MLQARLENVVAEKKQLEKDVERLKAELKKAQEMLLITNSVKGGDHNNNNACEFSTSFEEGGSSGVVLDDATYHHHHECWQSGSEVMQVEELFTYFMGANYGSGLHEKRA